jgi:methylated-DNA-[protein]-cysteine S-methyltransferase
MIGFNQYLLTALGWLHIEATDEVVVRIRFADVVGVETPNELTRQAAIQLQAYLEKQRISFDLPLQMQGTAFQQKVWLELRHLPYGCTINYLDLARRLGNEKSIRAVAHAVALNPLLIVIPCHRVIGSKGSLTGYAGGLWRKRKLLETEGVLGQQTEIEW